MADEKRGGIGLQMVAGDGADVSSEEHERVRRLVCGILVL
jgi:hypothetical protein